MMKKGKKRAAPLAAEGAELETKRPKKKARKAVDGSGVAAEAKPKKLKKLRKGVAAAEAAENDSVATQSSPRQVPQPSPTPAPKGKKLKKRRLAEKEEELPPTSAAAVKNGKPAKGGKTQPKSDKHATENDPSAAQPVDSQPKDNNAFKVYVGGIPYDTPEETVREDFAECGEIAEFIALKADDGKFKGICFITFKTRKGVEKALDYDGDEYGGRMLKVRMANNREEREKDPYFANRNTGDKIDKNSLKVFVGGIPWDTDEQTIREDFEECGEIDSLACLKDDQGRFKGICFITFKNQAGVEAALKYDGDEYGGRNLKVAMASARRDKGGADSGGAAKGGKGQAKGEGEGKAKGKGKGKQKGKEKGKGKSKGKGGKGVKGKEKGKSKGKSKGATLDGETNTKQSSGKDVKPDGQKKKKLKKKDRDGDKT